MAVYIALLRGINVGGHNKIQMAKLRETLQAAGLEAVRTYIQSGNIAFAAAASEEQVRELVARAIASDFGLQLEVVLRTAAELEALIAANPYADRELGERESVQVCFLNAAPEEALTGGVTDYESEVVDYRIVGRDIYQLYHQGLRDAKLPPALNKLWKRATMRNWRTVLKLRELAEQTAREAGECTTNATRTGPSV
ncbi:DUF1697 domain-containing protein [Paenibacillus sp. IB182496]|uniref:DUF1697 domain-containing protein n=1 Tax=Paenibacillus sabuli TaxID=2772509 RepID=A0A927BQX2_9BACL|nr:DUF1697 domain-containing protein [Paenibacillus sabuli]MBD2844115.1 DUF1697 domain-containing protein [Paenibacillus sabuli]